MDRSTVPPNVTSAEANELRRQVQALDRRIARLEARDHGREPAHSLYQLTDDLPARVRGIVRQQSAILAATTLLSAIAVFLIVRLAM